MTNGYVPVPESEAAVPLPSAPATQGPTPAAPPARSRAPWLRAGLRMLAFRRPHWAGLEAGPGRVLGLVLLSYLLTLGVQWLWVDGDARFYWTAALNGWAAVALFVWMCWVVARSAHSARSAREPGPEAVPGAGTLLAVMLVAGLLMNLFLHLPLRLLAPAVGPSDEWPIEWRWAVWGLPLAWGGLSSLVLLWRVAGTVPARLMVLCGVPLALAVSAWLQPVMFWWPEPKEGGESTESVFMPLTEDVLAAQPRLLAQALDGLAPPRPGRVNVYAATYAPYASEDVFMRESAVVSKTLRERFGAEGRSVELVMNRATATTLPWATHEHLRQTIARMARVMDRERDVLFLHLTSHGGRDGQLAAQAWPLETAALTPGLLKQWLDEAGVRWRVISVSACYSGSWIEPLAGDGTLVMTAADATHTSYGCGTRSPLTFFAQALYVDALQSSWSFPAAHARARVLIEQRERDVGKSDGYSNPQIRLGPAIAPVLERLEVQQRGW